jgi:hypothetical protein
MTDNKREANAEERIKLDHPFSFTALTGEHLHTRIRKLVWEAGAGWAACTLVLELSWDVYEAVLAGEYFGLHAVARGDLQLASFERGRSVELTLKLKPSLTKVAAERHDDAEAILRKLLQRSAEEAAVPLHMSECWLAAEVKQQIEWPEELFDGGSLKKGYRTLWGLDSQAGARIGTGSVAGKAPFLDTAKMALSQRGWPYEQVDEQTLRLEVRGERGQWIAIVRTDDAVGLCVIYSVFPERVPELIRRQVAAALLFLNYELSTGSFDMDETDGELRFRTGVDVESGWLTPNLFDRLITSNISGMDYYFGDLTEQLKMKQE